MPNWYYVWDDDLRADLVGDNESQIAWLCDCCAEELEARGLVPFASSDDLCEQACWRCGLYGDGDADNPDDRPDWWLETDYEDRVCGKEV